MNNDDRWIDESDLESYTGLSKSFWQKQRTTCTGPAYSKIGRAVRYRLADVINFLESHKSKGTPRCDETAQQGAKQ